MLSKSAISDAHQRIIPFIHRTPVLTSTTLDGMANCQLYFKCENLQKVGAFKYRGATNAILQLDKKMRKNGVVTHSSGNHAQALALAAKMANIRCYVVMPSNSPSVKIDAVKGYGAQVTLCPPTLKDREEYTAKIILETDATFIAPYNDYQIVCGQATSAKELIEDFPDLDFIIAPVGGGGLLSGSILAAHYFSPHTKVIGAEPLGADDAYRSLQTGERVTQHQPHTIADGLLTTLGDITWPIIRDGVHRIITVSDDEIKQALKLVLQRMKIVIEPSSATALAAVLQQKELFKGKRVGIILSGGNYDLY